MSDEVRQPKPPAPCKYCGKPVQWIFDPEAQKRRPFEVETLHWHKCPGPERKPST